MHSTLLGSGSAQSQVKGLVSGFCFCFFVQVISVNEVGIFFHVFLAFCFIYLHLELLFESFAFDLQSKEFLRWGFISRSLVGNSLVSGWFAQATDGSHV